MCTVVCRHAPAEPIPVQLLALRDELADRAFDLPDAWWPQQPSVVGGRDRTAGGSWCVTDVASGVTAVVLNSPLRRTAEPGAPSRGALPLLAVEYGEAWVDHIDIAPMAGFHLVLVTPATLTWWAFTGADLARTELAPSTHLFKPHGLDDAHLDPRLTAGASSWPAVLDDATPTDDPGGLLVRLAVGAGSYETVFAQLLTSRPGELRLEYRERPAREPSGTWVTAAWQSIGTIVRRR